MMDKKDFFKKNIFNVCGVVLGIIAAIVGITIIGGSIYIGSSTSFGADFYTYIYNVTRATGTAVNAVIDAVGAVVLFIGLITACFFGNNIVINTRNDKVDRDLNYIIRAQTQKIIEELKIIETNQCSLQNNEGGKDENK